MNFLFMLLATFTGLVAIVVVFILSVFIAKYPAEFFSIIIMALLSLVAGLWIFELLGWWTY